MNEELEFRCPKCGKLLDGITLDYRLEWLCSKCAEDQSDVLHCERGCKVKAVDLDAGLSSDSKQAHELLTEGHVYEVEKNPRRRLVLLYPAQRVPRQRV